MLDMLFSDSLWRTDSAIGFPEHFTIIQANLWCSAVSWKFNSTRQRKLSWDFSMGDRVFSSREVNKSHIIFWENDYARNLIDKELHPLFNWISSRLLLDITGNPFRPPVALPGTPTVVELARTAYLERMEEGRLNPFLLNVLADALEDANVADPSIGQLLRDERHCPRCSPIKKTCFFCHKTNYFPIGHFRGLWVINQILQQNNPFWFHSLHSQEKI